MLPELPEHERRGPGCQTGDVEIPVRRMPRSNITRLFGPWRWSSLSRHTSCALVPVLAGIGQFPDAIFAQAKEEASQPPAPSFVFDSLIVVVLFGLAVFVICRAGRRN